LENNLKKLINKYWLLVTVAGIIIALDQVTKAIVRTNIPFRESWMPWGWLSPYFRFVHWENTGAAFGLFQGGGIVFGVLAGIVSLFIIFYYPQIPEEEKLMRIAMGMQLAGALGNLIDRIVFGPVTDFISVGNFAVFNVADSSITIGVGLLILSLWINERKEIAARETLISAENASVEDVEEEL